MKRFNTEWFEEQENHSPPQPLLPVLKRVKINENWWEARPDDSQEDAQRVEETIQPVQPVRPVLNGKQMIRMNATPVDSEEEMLSDEEEMLSDKKEEVAPVRPVRPVLNGKQMIWMNASPLACFLKDRRKNPNPERAKPQKRVGFYMCRPCRDTIIVETNGKLTCTLCFECKRKNF